MTRIVWDPVGSRKYEVGVDRGVLYVPGLPGVPWHGLTAVDERETGGEAKAYWQDGVKYLNLAADTDFEAVLSAYYSPVEFDACDGIVELAKGLRVTRQVRKPFGLSYRTLIGNDVDGTTFGYKIHLIYNALAEPSARDNKTLSDNIDPNQLSWNISTTPEDMGTNVFSAHLTIDSTEAVPGILAEVERILYGSEVYEPRLPTPSELIGIFQSYDDLTVVDNGDGTFTVTGRDDIVQMVSDEMFTIDSAEAVMIGSDTYTLTGGP